MELKDFVKKVIIDLDCAVKEAGNETEHGISFSEKKDKRTVEFDIAVTTEKLDAKSGKAGIKVLQFADAGGNISRENKNSTVSRITFGIHIDSISKGVADKISKQFNNAEPAQYR